MFVRISALTLVSTASPGDKGSKRCEYSSISAFKILLASSGCVESNKVLTLRDLLARRGIFIPGDITKQLFFLSTNAFRSLSVSSPMIPSKVSKPGRTKKVRVELFPSFSKNFPATRRVILTEPVAD